ncbi:hypothetical protein DM800_14115 [Bacillus sp. AY18-3]|nr:hypothetical protein DM800_14115 [Bacillus sp. AY18-3]
MMNLGKLALIEALILGGFTGVSAVNTQPAVTVSVQKAVQSY